MIVDGQTTTARFGEYLLVEHIGSGGMAAVYLATSGESSAPVVIKRILPHLAADQSFVKMLVTEGKLTARLRHRNIVRLIEIGEAQGETFLAMEHVAGFDLHSVLRTARDLGRPLPPEVCFYLARELADALSYAHEVTDDAGRPGGIVHRDISPSNIMVTPDGAVKLLDFGVAKALGSLRDEQTRTGTLKGKLGYMSPEQADGEPIDARSDLFSLGIVLHELLTMRRLFRAEDDLKILRLVREAHVLAPSLLGAGIGEDADAVVLRMLARRPEDRYDSCAVLVDALQPFAGTSEDLIRYLRQLEPIQRSPIAVPRKPAATRTFAGVPDDLPDAISQAAADTRLEPRAGSYLRRKRSSAAYLVAAAVGTSSIAAAYAFHARHAPAPVEAQVTTLAPATVTPAPPPVTPKADTLAPRIDPVEAPPRGPARKVVRRTAPAAHSPRPVGTPPGLYDPFKR